MFGHLTSAVSQILPEIVLLAAACVNLAVGPFLTGESGQAVSGIRHRWGVWSLLALLIAGWCSLIPTPVIEATELAPFQVDTLVWFVRLITLVTLVFTSNIFLFFALHMLHVKIGIAFFLWVGVFNKREMPTQPLVHFQLERSLGKEFEKKSDVVSVAWVHTNDSTLIDPQAGH